MRAVEYKIIFALFYITLIPEPVFGMGVFNFGALVLKGDINKVNRMGMFINLHAI